ncbi:HIT-like protein [Panaeolus papilionaceus]|nr:HIT-like protein [Panaeolus papilionaceus]
MTSFIINDHVGRELSALWKDPDCTFCKIIAGELPTSKVYEDDEIIAILDIQPLRRGHTLVIPKSHVQRLSDLSPDQAAAVGKTVSKVARALTLADSLDNTALENTGLNVVCNQEYAQAVPHVHYHVIPAPRFGGEGGVEDTNKAVGGKAPLTHKEMHRLELNSREELDDDDAIVLLEKIRARL